MDGGSLGFTSSEVGKRQICMHEGEGSGTYMDFVVGFGSGNCDLSGPDFLVDIARY